MPAVIVPWRASSTERQAAWDWVRARYAERHPDWEIIVAEQPTGEWVKARAIMPAVAKCASDVVVVADADVWCEGLGDAVEAVRAGAGWAIPHDTVYRLSARATRMVLDGADPRGQETDGEPYKVTAGGGLVVGQRGILRDIPLDPRFRGSSGADVAWAFALRSLAGKPWHGTAPAFHLWHPPDPRSDLVGGLPAASLRLRRRYRLAHYSARWMRKIINEINEAP